MGDHTGPPGCPAGVFTAQYGPDMLIFDRGKAALPHSASLANYRGCPAGIDIETFRDLIHDHAREVGCEVVEEMVVSITETAADGARVHIETQDSSRLAADHVIAAAWYDGTSSKNIENGLTSRSRIV